MSKFTPKLRGLAERLIAHETRRHSAEIKSESDFAVIDKMRPHLATLMGNAGFHGLLSRSLSLANAECDWLRAVRVNMNGSLKWRDEIETQAGHEEVREGRVILLSQLLGLLVTFIGQNLTVRLLRDVWPDLHEGDFGSDEESKNEKTK